MMDPVVFLLTVGILALSIVILDWYENHRGA